MSARRFAAGFLALWIAAPLRAAGPSYVDLTWLSVTNIYCEIGSLRILTVGYITPVMNESVKCALGAARD